MDPQTDGFDPSPLKAYMARLGGPYFYEGAPLIEMADACMAKGDNRVSICSFCSRMKRGILYSTARRDAAEAEARSAASAAAAERCVMANPNPNPNP